MIEMKDRVQKVLMFSLSLVLIISYLVMVVFVYRQDLRLMKYEVKQEAKYIQEAVNIAGPQYLESIDNVDKNTRITKIDKDGKVLYDSQGRKDLENHKTRKEVVEALKNGYGEDVRRSETIGKNMYYYALLLNDKSVIRVSKTMYNMVAIAIDFLPFMLGIFLIMLLLSWMIARWQTRRIIGPINDIDLENPLENITYRELEPLLVAMDLNNKQKDMVSNMRKEFSANVSHELKTPLTSISGYAEIMKNGIVKEKDIPNFADRIYKEASRLIKLVNDIINISRLDEGYVDIEKEDVDLFEMSREISSRLAKQANDKGIKVALEGERVICHGIRQILDDMVYNLVENAIKYNKENGKVTIWVGSTLDGVKIRVTDTGIGIADEETDRIFERFYRVDKSHSKEIGGTGLGLSIVKHGAMVHGASLSVDSKLGEGSVFEIRFPNA
ncbi:Alkaline phosphatase synthesis sensor protein phoR [Peptostreptococcus anaerobius]|uniref:histidine kinase n=2 Tax=Peptostreptococcus anaerobius TaxID=1261 RepID=A0A379CJ14_9FIRM|nr:two-component system, OmpR family, phosphate regulon sensor histidine kinase PhoR [Peptostreptococcus anaerobius]SUB62009.1 Alkaline phosphatase synthesis sensor protein phoR [Peptostreptococcus anaerobius]